MKKIGIKLKKNSIEYLPITWNHWGTYLIAWRKVVWGIGFCCCCLVVKLCPSPCNPINSSSPGILVLRYLPHFAQTHVHWVDDAIKTSHFLPPPPLTFNLSQHQGLSRWVCSSHQVAKVLELQLQHQSFQWIWWWPLPEIRQEVYPNSWCSTFFPFLWGEGGGRGDRDGEHM